jgi:DNA-binding MarR family transcriptional regulator
MEFPSLDPIIHQVTRLRIMGALYRNRELSYKLLRDGLGLTDGNVVSHAQKLEQAGYVASRRALVGVGFQVVYRITPAGSDAFERYLAALRQLLEGMAPRPLDEPKPLAKQGLEPPHDAWGSQEPERR